MRIENWTSSEGRKEVHYFRAKDDEYLFGYNPLIMPEELVDNLREWAKVIVDGKLKKKTSLSQKKEEE